MLTVSLFAGARPPRLAIDRLRSSVQSLVNTRGRIHMKRLLIAGALALLAGGQMFLAGPLFAADLPYPRPVPQAPGIYYPPPPLYSWTGFYIGLNGGGAFGNSNWTDPNDLPTGNFNVSGGLVGGTVGGNYQIGQFVLGIEADGDWANISGTTFNGGCGGVGCTTQSNWLATVRGRAGYAWDRVLFYGTGGAAFANIQGSAGAFPFSNSTQTGWTAGLGLEYAFLPNWSAKVEYLYAGLGTASCPAANCGATGGINTNVALNENIIRGGINFKFGPGGFGW
jgi:outer membrane immunogenic protein